MPLDPVIAGGFRGLQLQDPLEQYARIAQLQQGQQQNALNALKMQEYQREREAENRLRALYARPGVDIRSPEFLREVYAVSPTKGAAAQKAALEAEKERRLSDAALADLAAKQMKMARDLLPSVTTPEAYANWRAYTVKNLPGLAGVIPEQYSPEATRTLMLEADKALEQHFVTQNLGGAQQVVAMPKYGQGEGRVVPGSRAADVPLPPDVEAQKARIAKESRAQTTINLPEQEKAFETELGKGQAKKLLDDKAVAEDAASIIGTVQQGRQLLQSGMITGFGAEALTQIGAALNQAGISFAADSVANTQAFAANMAQNVGRIIKQFGAGTGLSNADREYAEKMAGGKITLDRKSIERILDINERAARNVISSYNKRASSVKTNVPLTIEMPAAAPPPAAPSERPSLQDIFQPKR